MKKTNRKMLIIVLLLAILLCLYFVTSTYSKYISSTSSSETVGVAKWSIQLNGKDVSTSGTAYKANQLLSLTPVSNDKVAANTIAPKSTAQGEIELNPEGTQVALKYTIELDTASYSGTTLPNLTYSLKVGGSSVDLTDGSYTGKIALPDGTDGKTAMTSDQKTTITVIATWDTNGDDETDTSIGIEAGTITIPVTVTVEQDV